MERSRRGPWSAAQPPGTMVGGGAKLAPVPPVLCRRSVAIPDRPRALRAQQGDAGNESAPRPDATGGGADWRAGFVRVREVSPA